MPKDVRFWRNVAMIGLAHVALVVGLIRWGSQANPAPSQSIVWMDAGAGESGAVAPHLAPETPKAIVAKSPTPIPEPETTPANQPDEEDSAILTAARSEIQMPTVTPTQTPTPIATPPPKSTPVVKTTPKPTPKSTPKSTPKPKP